MSTTLNVLIIGTCPADAESATALLERVGFRLQWACVDSEQDFVAHLDPPPDLILADYSSTQFSGLGALERLRERDLDIPLIFLSDTPGEEVAVECLKQGAADYILKNRLARLEPAVRRALEEKRLREQKRHAEHQAREQDRRFRKLVENSSDGLLLFDAKGTILYTSPSAGRILGRGPSELEQENAFDLVHPDDQPFLRRKQAELLQNPPLGAPIQFRVRHLDGSWRWIEAHARNLLDEPSVHGILVNYRDVTDRKQSEEELRQHAAYQVALNKIIASATEMTSDLKVILEIALDETCRALQLEMGAIGLVSTQEYEPIAIQRGMLSPGGGLLSLFEEAQRVSLLAPLVVHDWRVAEHPFAPKAQEFGLGASIVVPLLVGGTHIGSLAVASKEPRTWSNGEIGRLETIGRQLGMVVERARLFQETSQRAQQLALLYDAGLAMNSALDIQTLIEYLLKVLNEAVHAERTDLFRYDPARKRLYCEAGAGYTSEMDWADFRTFTVALGEDRGLVGRAAADRVPVYLPDVLKDSRWIPFDPTLRSGLWVPVEREGKLRGVLAITSTRVNAFTPADQRLVILFAHQLSFAMENARLFEETRRRMKEFTAIAQVSAALRRAHTRAEMLPIILNEVTGLIQATGAALLLCHPVVGDAITELAWGAWENWKGLRWPFAGGITGNVISTGEAYQTSDLGIDPLFPRPELVGNVRAAACLPLRADEQPIGALWVGRTRELTQEEMHLLGAVCDISANAIRRTTLHEQTEERLQRLTSMRAIDMAIGSSLDLRMTLTVLLEHVVTQLQIDAADVLLLDPHTRILEQVASRGFRTGSAERLQVRLGEEHGGQVPLELRRVSVPDLRQDPFRGPRAALMRNEGFVSYFAAPLLVKGQVKGVLEVFHRTLLMPDPEWLEFLETLAGQAALAVDSAAMFSSLQRANFELTMAYDTTLEGWSRALDLRDKETEGHTKRVAELTVQLAKAMGVGDEELVHIRRGALLHDIGKMAIPDRILLKPGPLTEEEWAIMRKHPIYAHDLLAQIPYLRPALAIPYNHHEKWDGTGYPRGLKGLAIPSAARIFAIVDVWDALRSDRPYRPAWTEEQARAYLAEQSDKHFDPRAVETFLRFTDLA